MDYLELEESTIEEIYELLENTDNEDTHPHRGGGGRRHRPSRAYIREKRAMKATLADILEYPNEYHFVIDMPGLKPEEIKVHIEEGNLLVVWGERRRRERERSEKEGGEVKYVAMQRRLGKFLKKFVLPDNADQEKVSACCEDGVVTVVVGKKAAEPKKQVTVEVKVGSPAGMVGDGGSK